MFFKNMNSWSDYQLKVNYISYTLIYYLLTLIAPSVVIGIKYGLFTNAIKERALNGLLIILFMVVILVALRMFKKTVERMPDVKVKDQRIKYGLLTMYNVAVPLVLLILLVISHAQLELAYSTALWCIGFIVGGILIDGLFIQFIDRQRQFRAKQDEREVLSEIAEARAKSKKK